MPVNSKSNVAIIDFGMGNLFSIKRACEHAGLSAFITSDSAGIVNSDSAILPGVGAFGIAMRNIKKLDLAGPIKDFIGTGRPFMGICLGMQLLLTKSEEFGVHEGLNIIKGSVVNFSSGRDSNKGMKVPQVGWNKLKRPDDKKGDYWEDSLLRGIRDGEFMYFVHSYFVAPDTHDSVLSYTSYEGIRYCSSLERDNIFACQFHPERSAGQGLKIYQNWAELIRKKENR
ncbi:MAG: imidazole glycerol phosphate synthase subunit HisH [Candidatus Omnitrophota bacterium]